MSKNQIWVVIVVLAIGVIALISDIQIKVEIGTEDYANEDECYHKQVLKCPAGGGQSCANSAYYYCEGLDYPKAE